jgi:hypothetical protein
MIRPFRVYKGGSGWFLQHRFPVIRGGVATFPVTGAFDTAADANDYAHKHWPWWP